MSLRLVRNPHIKNSVVTTTNALLYVAEGAVVVAGVVGILVVIGVEVC